MYKIVCKENNKVYIVYIGVSKDPEQRFKQHMRKAPLRLQADLLQYGKGALLAFYMSTLAGCVDEVDQKFLERFFIVRHNALRPGGYNTLKGAPTSDRQFWAMHRARMARG